MVVVGFDGSPDALASIGEGKLNASVAQSPFNIGFKSVEAAVKAAKGEAVEKRIDTGTEIPLLDGPTRMQLLPWIHPKNLFDQTNIYHSIFNGSSPSSIHLINV